MTIPFIESKSFYFLFRDHFLKKEKSIINFKYYEL